MVGRLGSVIAADRLQVLLVATADAFMLAEMFVPGADNELLKHASGIGRVSPHAPTDRACAASRVAHAVQRFDEVLLEPWPRTVSSVTCTGPSVAAASTSWGAGQSPAGNSSAGGIGLNGSRSPARATSTSPTAAARSAPVSPAFCAMTPNAALPSAPPPWKITR